MFVQLFLCSTFVGGIDVIPLKKAVSKEKAFLHSPVLYQPFDLICTSTAMCIYIIWPATYTGNAVSTLSFVAIAHLLQYATFKYTCFYWLPKWLTVINAYAVVL
jgi:hypothetical protein